MKKLKDILARWHLRKMQGNMEPAARSFPGDLMSPKNILVCLPGTLRELTMVKQFLPGISSLFKSASVTLLAMPGVRVHDIYPRRGFNILTPATDQMSWSGMPKQSYLKILQDYKFDMVIDMNLERSLFTSAVLLSFPKAIRIGRGNHLGNPYYNLEIKTKYLRDERNIYRSLLETLEHIIRPAGKEPSTTIGG
ncbi:MAG: hypothetical protein PVH24_05340 [Candidatus Zixiibacteriota bacterium]|jgi:hypothetical protein